MYYLGMMLSSNGMFKQSKNKRLFIGFCCSILAAMWVWLMTIGRLPFDDWMSLYWGGGFNPPSINFMVYASLVLLICYSFFSLLSDLEYKATRKLIGLLVFFGKNTLYIWLYHFLIISYFVEHFPDLRDSNIAIRIVVFGIIVTMPAIIKKIISECYDFCYKKIMQAPKETNSYND